ncbi:hypothetical protein TWF970_002269 [Orbilia oligospora]|uniref:Uncharacterized protein n=1 Tax=Orbilia oligospora TaxID=2813651 RepID=A0A7C8R9Q7_ORBOL|nr:hypothetical protein TWF970_002269 [Orbilia oligospora]
MFQPKKRARPCPMLDDNGIREEMRLLYQLLGWTPKEIAAEINKNHKLTVTGPQVRDKLNKLGYKKRFCPKQTKAIFREMVRRKNMGKESEVLIGGIITLSGKKLQRSIRRNLTLTEQNHISKGIQVELANELSEYLQVCTPQAHDMDLVLLRPQTIRHIPLLILHNLPIWQFVSQLIEKPTLRSSKNAHDHNNLKVTAHGSIPHSPLLRLIIYKISNNLTNDLDWNGEIMKYLDGINEFGLREAFKRLLSNTSLSIAAASEIIAPWLYVRQDLELLEFILRIHNGIKLRPFRILGMFGYRRRFLTLNTNWIEMALKDIETTKDLPGSHEDLGLLLLACKRARGDISLFQRLWNRKAFPEFITWPGFSMGDCLHESTPLLAEDESILRLLLSLGFTRFKWALALRAVLLDNYSITKVFLEHDGLIPSDRSSLPGPGDSCGHSHVWEMLGIPMFYGIVAQFVTTEIIPRYATSAFTTLSPADFKLALEYNINRVLVLAACLNPEITEYVIQVMEWANAALTESEVVKLAIELLPCCQDEPRKHNYWVYYNVNRILNLRSNFRPLVVFRKLFRTDIDLTQTELWQHIIWKSLYRRYSFGDKEPPAGGSLEYLRIFLQWPGAVDCELDLYPLLRNGYSKAHAFCNISDPIKPIVAAFLFEEPAVFLLLLESGASIVDIPTERDAQLGLTINTEFIDACQTHNLRRVCDLWDYRIEAADKFRISFSGGDQVAAYLRGWEPEAISDLLPHLQDPLSRFEVFKFVIKRVKRLTSSFGHARLVYFTILRSLIDSGILQDIRDSDDRGHGESFSNFNSEYPATLLTAIKDDDLEFAEILFEISDHLNLYVRENGDEVLFSVVNKINRKYTPYAFYAAFYGISALKFLMRQGFDITVPDKDPRSSGRLTALHGALLSGNMDTLVFVLQSGADIYAPCGDCESAIESAVCEGRIDAVALILAVDPNCHYLALKAAEKTEYEYIAEYVRNWTPESSSVFQNQGGSIENISERPSVAFPVELL